MTTEKEMLTSTSQCGHLEYMAKEGFLRFGIMMNLKPGHVGESRRAPLLDQLRESKQGRLSVTSKSSYLVINYCPICGGKIKEQEQPEAEEEK